METLRLRVHPGLRADRDDRRDHPARRRRPRPRAAGPTCCARAASPTRGSRCGSSTPRPARTCPPARSASCGPARTRTWPATGTTRTATAEAHHRPTAGSSTGDAGYLDDDGFLYLHDRVKDMIVSGGENVYPAEVENVLAKHPGVADVAVIGVPDERWGEAVKAIVVRGRRRRRRPRTSSSPSPASTSPATSCRSRSTSPTTLPRNPSGKLLKRELREPYWAGRGPPHRLTDGDLAALTAARRRERRQNALIAARTRGSLTGRAVPRVWANRLTRSSSSSQAMSTTSGRGGAPGAGRRGPR